LKGLADEQRMKFGFLHHARLRTFQSLGQSNRARESVHPRASVMVPSGSHVQLPIIAWGIRIVGHQPID
jgi:hypothetical protein